MTARAFRGGLALAAALFLVLALLGARVDSITLDEGPFFHYGLLHLEGPVARKQVFNSKLPATALHALPAHLARGLAGDPSTITAEGTWAPRAWALALGRAVGAMLGAGLVVGVGLAARSLGGARAGLAAALVAALEPNLLAHFHLVTSEGPATLSVLLLALALARLARTQRARDAALAGFALGLALLSKFLLLVLVPLAPLAVAVHAVIERRRWTARAALAALGAFALAAIVTLDAGHLFRGVPGRLPVEPRSRKVARVASVLGQIPLPVPETWLEGLDWTSGDEEKGKSYGNLYLLGSVQAGPEKRGFPHYYLVALALKLPLGLIALATCGLALARERRADRAVGLVLGVGLVGFLSLGSKAQIGARHVLPLVPFLAIEAGLGVAALRGRGPRAGAVAAALLVWIAASTVRYAPDFVPYVNELIPDRRLAWRALADSNLDWGQARETLREWVAAEERAGRAVAFEPREPCPGRVVVSANALAGVTAPPERFAWLRERTPVAQVRSAYLVFDVAPR